MTRSFLRSFRLVCKKQEIFPLEALLRAQGFVFEQDSFYPPARRLLREPLPLGSSLAAAFGCIYIQDRSSMLPPLALAPPPGAAVLDMCASPGGKTGLLAQLVGPAGFILGNEPGKSRLPTLRRNLLRQGLPACATSAHSGEAMPLPEGIWPRILLDPPCSGWGTAQKNPRVLTLWREEKIAPLIGLQRRLLAEAARLLRPGGFLVYSTCTTNQAENEDQVLQACGEFALEILPLETPSGFNRLPCALPKAGDCLRVGGDGQGFFVALLRKPAAGNQPESSVPPESPVPPPLLPRRVIFPAGGILEDPWRQCADLPPGEIIQDRETLRFLPEAGLKLLPSSFAWTGFPLGRGRISPLLRTLLPDRKTAAGLGLPCLDLEDARPLEDLLSGKIFPVNCREREIGLYFQDLPLCLLNVKGRRAVLPSPGRAAL
jgi:16S rRNA (cytosine1407-C5)-methyltransferase